MRRRRLLLGACLLAVLAATGLAVWHALPAPGVTLKNFRRLEEGMSEPEVEAILGAPDGELIPGEAKVWRRQRVVVVVTFDENERVLNAAWEELPSGTTRRHYEELPEAPDLIARLRRLLPW